MIKSPEVKAFEMFISHPFGNNLRRKYPDGGYPDCRQGNFRNII